MSYTLLAFEPHAPEFALFQSLGTEAVILQPRTTCYLALEEGNPQARLSCQIATDLHDAPSPCGLIGHYEARSEQAGIMLLNKAIEDFKARGITSIIGPMNGSTWERYRFALQKDPDEKTFIPSTFLGEPRNPPEYPQHFIKAGFSLIEEYQSRITNRLNVREESTARVLRKLERIGMTIHPLDLKNYDKQLQEIYELSTAAFAKNMFYSPISFEKFQSLYQGIKPYLDPDFILLAKDKEHKLAGFVFGYPDLESIEKGRPTRLILKTLAADERYRMSGVAVALWDLFHTKAHEKGYHHVIHALMHSENMSSRISHKVFQSDLFKKYALFGFGTLTQNYNSNL